VYDVGDAGTYPGWPFFLPDDGAIVFAIGITTDFSANGVGLLTGSSASAPSSDLFILDRASGKVTLLAQAVGFSSVSDATSGTSYLPYSASDELHHNYDPIGAPVAAGGYYWVFFDSYRHYGNQGLERQLWGTAIDVSGSGAYSRDPSHPAFYVTGQEPGTGNYRAVATIDPCQSDGSSCTAGIDCCAGLCTAGQCGSPSPRCSNAEEICGAGHACCTSTLKCIAGFCTTTVQ
jgi:hypothetical protein